MSRSHANIAHSLQKIIKGLDLDLTPTDVKILRCLADMPFPAGYRTFQTDLGINTAQVHAGLKRMMTQELIEKTKDRRYNITVHGRATLQKVAAAYIKAAKRYAA